MAHVALVYKRVMVKRYGDTDFITGMRAFAALAVVFLHSGGAGFREFGAWGNRFVDLGAAGVYVFFVISGFSVSASFYSSSGYRDYLSKRLKRIAPLYFFWIAVCLSIGGQEASLYDLAMHLTFLNVFDYRVANSIVMVEWTISIEVFYYLLVPLALAYCRGFVGTLVLLVCTFALYKLAEWALPLLPGDADQKALALHWSPIPYAFCFAFGIAAYRFRHFWQSGPTLANIVLGASVAALSVYVWRPWYVTGSTFDKLALVTVLTFGLVAFGTSQSRVFATILNNPISQYLGLISYGIYLSHYPLFRWFIEPTIADPALRFVATSCAAIVISAATYVAIEKPVARLRQYRLREQSPRT